MSIEHITDHFHQAIVALVPPYWGKPNIAALLNSYVRQIQALEDDAFAVANAFDINTCDSTRLAVLGRVVGQPNLGWDTATYRNVIRGKIATNRSRGTEEDLINVVRLAGDVEGEIGIRAAAPATVFITVFELVSLEGQTALAFLLPKARAAGVSLQLYVVVVGAANDALTWGSSNGSPVGGSLGSSDGTPTGDASYSVREF